MKFCPHCNAALDDSATFCTACGANLSQSNTQAKPNPPQPYYPPIDPCDHTREFNAADIAENKLFALLCYAAGLLGIVIAGLLAKDSTYVRFHIRESLKLTICKFLVGIIAAVLCFTVIVPIAAGICGVIIMVLSVIQFVNVCNNKAIETPIVRGLGFLK